MATGGPANVKRAKSGSARSRSDGDEERTCDSDDDFGLSLVSRESLDRSSPDMWPSQIPGVGDFVDLRSAKASGSRGANNSSSSSAPWNRPLETEDMYLMQQLSNLSTSFLIIEVKKLHDLAYKLGVEEAKEMTRGKYLNIFKSKRDR